MEIVLRGTYLWIREQATIRIRRLRGENTEEEMHSAHHGSIFGMLEIIEAGFVPDWKRLLAVRMSSEFHKEGGADISDFLSAEQMALLVKLWSRKCGVNWHLGICVKKSWDEHDYELQLCPPDPSGTIIWICDKRDDRRVNRKPRRQGAPIWAGYRCFPRGDEFIKATKRDFEQLEADELLGAGKSSGYLIKEGPKEIAGGGGN
ncbi:hypothetical protein EV356DRAFT_497359 [Viridothelium virens]|uniref:Uncharacterized protein n=1 Tax=Viridothelium virens TaxID=1048519 RepID=A0A6A6HG31_VIRVR|nr:hypothetical protein EV356DRAFT_497359 [Viridothelium virens]